MKLLECTCLSQSATVGSISILNIVGLLHVRCKVVSEHPHCMFKAFSDLSAFESMNIFNGYSMKFQWIRLSDQTHHYIKFSLDFRNIFREKREATTAQGPIAIRGIHTRPSDTYLLKWSVLFKFRHVESVKLVEDVSACNLAGPNSMKPVNNGILSSKYPFFIQNISYSIFDLYFQYLGFFVFDCWNRKRRSPFWMVETKRKLAFLLMESKRKLAFMMLELKRTLLFWCLNGKESTLFVCYNRKESFFWMLGSKRKLAFFDGIEKEAHFSFFDAWIEKKARSLFAGIEKKTCFFGCSNRKESSLFWCWLEWKSKHAFWMLESKERW